MSYSSESEDSSRTSGDPVISAFLVGYAQARSFYEEVAKLAAELCETKLKSCGIRAIVTWRAKSSTRLKAKLYQRAIAEPYKNTEQIRKDIVDLAGVRIALYFPNDSVKVDTIIRENFQLDIHKRFPEKPRYQDPRKSSKDTKFVQRFDGYLADHYRVHMITKNVAKREMRSDMKRTKPLIEIQVASVLMHSWAEVNHDLVYKELTGGTPPTQERRILDAINGLIHSGEVLLQQLQVDMDRRVKRQNGPFKDQFELKSFLKEKLKLDDSVRLDKLDILLEVLRQLNLNSPKALLPLLPYDQLDAQEPEITLMILDYIIPHKEDHSRPRNSISLAPKPLRIGFLNHWSRGQDRLILIGEDDFRDIYSQKMILSRAIEVVDAIRFPNRSIQLNITSELRIFHQLWSDITYFKPTRLKVGYEVSQRMVEALEELWGWFRDNNKVLFRISLRIARLDVPDMVKQLTKLQPPEYLQRKAGKGDKPLLRRTVSQERTEKVVHYIPSRIVGAMRERVSERRHHSDDKPKRSRRDREESSRYHHRTHRSSYN
ncbi:hypothetical protein EYC84_000887 [Monilinia fructicola]|uniref:RelA/SpoT domain-containing protein n=1 Tax=Monilinia fructicola TaxID=38448 RepID=A0A5M9JKN4_MONFR|nr:hypothetical protein EYC84_000887 [Monilinia fructicola]